MEPLSTASRKARHGLGAGEPASGCVVGASGDEAGALEGEAAGGGAALALPMITAGSPSLKTGAFRN